jgi:hypothetical protein
VIREGGQVPPGGGEGAGPPLVIREGVKFHLDHMFLQHTDYFYVAH